MCARDQGEEMASCLMWLDHKYGEKSKHRQEDKGQD